MHVVRKGVYDEFKPPFHSNVSRLYGGIVTVKYVSARFCRPSRHCFLCTETLQEHAKIQANGRLRRREASNGGSET